MELIIDNLYILNEIEFLCFLAPFYFEGRIHAKRVI